MILTALELSVGVAVAATVIVGITGGVCGWFLARHRFRLRGLVDALLSLPLVLPPTVTGYYLIVLLGRRGLLGQPLYELTGRSIPFTWVACVVAAAVMAFPLMFRAARVAFEEVDPRHELVAASLGHGPLSILLRVYVPLARRGLIAGLVLTFARALGEFGATLILAGNVAGRTQTLPLAIYEALMIGEDDTALAASLALTAVSVSVMLLAGRLTRSGR